MHFELWHVDSGNLIGTFATKAEALATVREMLRVDGDRLARSLLLGSEDARGRSRLLARGADLARLAHTPSNGTVRGTAERSNRRIFAKACR